MGNSKLLLNAPLSIDNLIVHLCNNYKNNTNDLNITLRKKLKVFLKLEFTKIIPYSITHHFLWLLCSQKQTSPMAISQHAANTNYVSTVQL